VTKPIDSGSSEYQGQRWKVDVLWAVVSLRRAIPMLVLRSLIFSILFYGFFALSAVAAAGISLISPKSLPPFTRFWSRAWLAMYRAICGVNYEVRGKENIPHGGCLLAVKHQSVWDTCALFAIFERPVYVLKSELMFIPFFGWARGTRIALAQSKQVVIFPEGTRTMIGQAANYKTGISHLYTALEVACVPVALNSGALWPRRKFLRPPGTIVVEVLSPISPGFGRKEMFDLMVGKIEDASERLCGTEKSSNSRQ
jgi:1-acyl-sn-glycerol-3-phosphate acyltransferase